MRWFHLLFHLISLALTGYSVYAMVKPTDQNKLAMSIFTIGTSILVMLTVAIKSKPNGQVFVLVGLVNTLIGLNLLAFHFLQNVIGFGQDEIMKLNYISNISFSASASLVTFYTLLRAHRYYSTLQYLKPT